MAASEAAGFLLPQEVSLSLAAGTEVLIHVFRDVLSAHDLDSAKVLPRVDARNTVKLTFNPKLRAAFLRLLIFRANAAAQLLHALYGPQPFLTAGGQLLRSCEGTQRRDPPGGLLFCLFIRPLVKRISDACRLDLNARYADDGKIVGEIDQVAKAYSILIDEGLENNFLLFKDKTSVWWPVMDTERVRKTFDCALDDDNDDKPLHGLIIFGSPVGSGAFVKNHPAEKGEKVDAVLDLVRPLEDAQKSLPLQRACLSVVIFNRTHKRTPPSQAIAPTLALDAQQARWPYLLLSAIPPFTSAVVTQSRPPLRLQGLGVSSPSDVSRIDTAQNLARLRPAAFFARTLAACDPLIDAHIPANNPPQKNDQPWSTAAIMDRSCRKTQKRLIKHVHDCRDSEFWPPNDAPLHSLTAENIGRASRRSNIASEGAPARLLEPAVNNRMRSDEFRLSVGRYIRLPICDYSLPCPACNLPADKFGDHHLSCAKSTAACATSCNERHNNVRDHLDSSTVPSAQLRSIRGPEGPVLDTHGKRNHDRPADMYIKYALALSKAGSDASELAIDVTVTKAHTSPFPSGGKSATTRGEGKERTDFATRVKDVIAALKDEGKDAWNPDFEFRAFGLDAYNGLGDEALSL